MDKTQFGGESVIEQKKLKYRKANEQDKRLAKQIQKIRKAKRMTQEELAERVRVSPLWIGYLETGYRVPSLRILYKIAKALGVKVKDLFPF